MHIQLDLDAWLLLFLFFFTLKDFKNRDANKIYDSVENCEVSLVLILVRILKTGLSILWGNYEEMNDVFTVGTSEA